MEKLRIPKDMFGTPVRARRPRYEAAIERVDRKHNPERAMRVRWISSVIPKNLSLGLPLETSLIFFEAKNSFIYGNFVATVVLSAAFIEHWFAASLAALGYEKESRNGLAASLSCARNNNLVAPLILDKVDRLREIRNPFIHLKSFEHEHGVAQRMGKTRVFDISVILEDDAKEALIAMYGVASYAFNR